MRRRKNCTHQTFKRFALLTVNIHHSSTTQLYGTQPCNLYNGTLHFKAVHDYSQIPAIDRNVPSSGSRTTSIWLVTQLRGRIGP